jgi:hypothetical protein
VYAYEYNSDQTLKKVRTIKSDGTYEFSATNGVKLVVQSMPFSSSADLQFTY